MNYLMGLQDRGQIKNIGLTNFDTEHMLGLIEQDAPIITNQVSYSILDSRPSELMAPACSEKGVKLVRSQLPIDIELFHYSHACIF